MVVKKAGGHCPPGRFVKSSATVPAPGVEKQGRLTAKGPIPAEDRAPRIDNGPGNYIAQAIAAGLVPVADVFVFKKATNSSSKLRLR